MGSLLLASRSAELFAQRPAVPVSNHWDAGRLRHLLPAVSDTQMLIKVSFLQPVTIAPTLHVGSITVRGRMSDSAGDCWQFRAVGLRPGQSYRLALSASNGQALCEPWDLSTFPSADATPDHFRVLFFTCAGGPDIPTLGFLPAEIRNRLLRRALSLQPQAVVANGDHVYWDLHYPRVPPERRNNTLLESFDRSALVFGNKNETVLKLAAGPQITSVYGTDFRSTPVFFLQDDHDYFDNDEGTDEIVTFPPPWFQLELARATQRMYYPEFLPHATRPSGLPWGSMGSAENGVSESWGTLRYGKLVEVLLYDVRRTVTLAGPSAVFIDPSVEQWLLARTAASDVTHLVHAPSNPPGWTAGKWMEWYPDVLDDAGQITTRIPKPYWQSGWMTQHGRLLTAISAAKKRIPLVVSGDLHAVGMARIERSGIQEFRSNPVVTVLSGPIGTSPSGWPSAFRGTPAIPPAHLEIQEDIKPIEQHSFTIADFLPDKITLRFFKWDLKNDPVEKIDALQPFKVIELPRPA
jgi:hypothetical protein